MVNAKFTTPETTKKFEKITYATQENVCKKIKAAGVKSGSVVLPHFRVPPKVKETAKFTSF